MSPHRANRLRTPSQPQAPLVSLVQSSGVVMEEVRYSHSLGRLINSDRHPSNMASEALMEKVEQHSVCRMFLACEMHMDNTTEKRVGAEIDSTREGMRRTCKSFETRGDWHPPLAYHI